LFFPGKLKMKNKFFCCLATAFILTGTVCAADVSPAGDLFVAGISGNVGSMNITPMTPMLGNPFFDYSSNSFEEPNEPAVKKTDTDPFSIIADGTDKVSPADPRSQLQGTWLARDGNTYIILVFTRSGFIMRTNSFAASGTWQLRDNTFTLFANGKFESHTFAVEGRNLIIDNGNTVLVKQDTFHNDFFNGGSGMQGTAVQPASVNPEGKWDLELDNGVVYSFIFDTGSYRSYVNNLQVGGGTYHMDGSMLRFKENFGQYAGHAGTDLLAQNGSSMTITFEDNATHTFTRNENFSSGKFISEQCGSLKGKWSIYLWMLNSHVTFVFDDGALFVYENGKLTGQAEYNIRDTLINLTWKSGRDVSSWKNDGDQAKTEVWSFCANGRYLQLLKPPYQTIVTMTGD